MRCAAAGRRSRRCRARRRRTHLRSGIHRRPRWCGREGGNRSAGRQAPPCRVGVDGVAVDVEGVAVQGDDVGRDVGFLDELAAAAWRRVPSDGSRWPPLTGPSRADAAPGPEVSQRITLGLLRWLSPAALTNCGCSPPSPESSWQLAVSARSELIDDCIEVPASSW